MISFSENDVWIIFWERWWNHSLGIMRTLFLGNDENIVPLGTIWHHSQRMMFESFFWTIIELFSENDDDIVSLETMMVSFLRNDDWNYSFE